MSIKAGRVGVNPSQVNPVDGSILSSATSGYTKDEADAKFETQTNASTEYDKLQPKTLTVPISMLQGSQLVSKTTVEDVVQTMNGAMSNVDLTSLAVHSKKIDFTYNTSVTSPGSQTVEINVGVDKAKILAIWIDSGD